MNIKSQSKIKVGILDPLGDNENPLTNQPYTEKYKSLAKAWSKLPAYDISQKAIKDIEDNRVTLVISGTGSGKTVLFPKYALHAGGYKNKIAITFPKRDIAKSSAAYAAATLDVELGRHVGYQYRGAETGSNTSETQLLYATDGTIVAKLLRDPKLSEYDTVIVDEAHERKVQIDFLLYLLRNTLRMRDDFKIIIMSATINPKIFEDYYKDFSFKKIEIGGKTNYPIKSIFLEKDMSYKESINKGFDILIDILKTTGKNSKNNDDESQDIIFFVTSSNEAKDICRRLTAHLSSVDQKGIITKHGDIFCVPIFSSSTAQSKDLATDKTKYKLKSNFYRKVVVATNVAESSLTIDGIKYVIDNGHELSSFYDPKYRSKILKKQYISKAQVKQRMGRSGRTSPGVCYHLYSEEVYKKVMLEYPEPSIRVNNIIMEIMRLLDMDNVKTLKRLNSIFAEFIEPPKKEYVDSAIVDLESLGMIKDKEITYLGSMVTKMPVNNIASSISIIYGHVYNCRSEVTNIISLMDNIKLNMGDMFIEPKRTLNKDLYLKEMKKFNKAKKIFMHPFGDHLSLLNIKLMFRKLENQDREKWCSGKYLKCKKIAKSVQDYKRIIGTIRKLDLSFEKINIYPRDDIEKMNLEDKILICLLMGHKLNTAIKSSNKDKYRTQQGFDTNLKISKDSFLNYQEEAPKNVFYSELFVNNNNGSLNIVSTISQKIIKNL